MNFFNGISVGAGVVISSYFGSKDDRNLHEAVETTVMLAVLTGACVAVLSFGIVPVMLDLMSTPDDVILFFSYSGATKDMLDVLRPARRRGAKIILVTHFAKSPAAAMADVTLLCGSKEGPLQSGSVAAKMGLLFIIDVLFNEYCRTNPALTEANREATAGAISAKLL